MVLASSFNFASILAQWSCSLMVLIKIYKVQQKINCNKLNIGNAKRFKKQVNCFLIVYSKYISGYFKQSNTDITSNVHK